MNDGTTPYNLQVGSFIFAIDDMPESLKIGRKLNNVVIRLSDGSRFLQEFGAESDDISFSGTFMYGDAVSRARSLDTVFLLRKPIQFSCDVYSSQVTITEYTYTIKNTNMVDYTLTMFVNDSIPYYLNDSRLDSLQNNAIAANNAVQGTSNALAMQQAQDLQNIIGTIGPFQ